MLVLNKIECASWMEMVTLSLLKSQFSHFSIGTQKYCHPKKGDHIAFNTACSSENFTYILRLLP